MASPTHGDPAPLWRTVAICPVSTRPGLASQAVPTPDSHSYVHAWQGLSRRDLIQTSCLPYTTPNKHSPEYARSTCPWEREEVQLQIHLSSLEHSLLGHLIWFSRLKECFDVVVVCFFCLQHHQYLCHLFWQEVTRTFPWTSVSATLRVTVCFLETTVTPTLNSTCAMKLPLEIKPFQRNPACFIILFDYLYTM